MLYRVLTFVIPIGLYIVTIGYAHSQESCLPQRMKPWVDKLQAQCGAKLGRTYAKGAVIAYSGGSPSLHGQCRAADITGNPSCLYKVLRNYPGQYSTDYARCCHVHIDDAVWGKGRTFKHRGPSCGCPTKRRR